MTLPKITPYFLKKQIPTSVIITGIICITLLEIVALRMGFNGTLLKIVLIGIAMAIGIVIPTPRLK